MSAGGARLRLAVVLDAALEDWTSMDYVGEMLVKTLRHEHSTKVDVSPIQPQAPRILGRLPGPARWLGKSLDRLAARCIVYPVAMARLRHQFDVFHIVDHSYAHTAHALPRNRTGIYCHDLDAVRPLLNDSSSEPHRKLLARSILHALERSAVVFYSTQQVRKEMADYGLRDERKLVYAPYGVAAEFAPSGPLDAEVEALLPQGLFILNVGNSSPRKRPELLLRAFAHLRATAPDIFLVQQGGGFSHIRNPLLVDLVSRGAVIQFPRLPRSALAHLYRRASLVVLPSEREGFGLPLIEALACSTPVLASDIPAFREVGAAAVSYCNSAEPRDWAEAILGLMRGDRSGPTREARLAQAERFSWSRHANTIVNAYRALT
jgi:glycosyltransferase involved in cell wall biosynthesis